MAHKLSHTGGNRPSSDARLGGFGLPGSRVMSKSFGDREQLAFLAVKNCQVVCRRQPGDWQGGHRTIPLQNARSQLKTNSWPPQTICQTYTDKRPLTGPFVSRSQDPLRLAACWQILDIDRSWAAFPDDLTIALEFTIHQDGYAIDLAVSRRSKNRNVSRRSGVIGVRDT